jgi:hypothetical protein
MVMMFSAFAPIGTGDTKKKQVLAMLTVWGVADLKKLEEVRIIHTEEVYQ